MLARKDTHLIYIDNVNNVWMEEHGIGSAHPLHAEFYCEVPSNEDKKWINGTPKEKNVQFLTLCPFYPSQRLDVSIEINRVPQIMIYKNHPAFEGCVKYMPITELNFLPIPKHIERSLYKVRL